MPGEAGYAKPIAELIGPRVVDDLRAKLLLKLGQHDITTVGCFISHSMLGQGDMLNNAGIDAFIDDTSGSSATQAAVVLPKDEPTRVAIRHMTMLARAIHLQAGSLVSTAAQLPSLTETQLTEQKEDQALGWWKKQQSGYLAQTLHNPHPAELLEGLTMHKFVVGLQQENLVKPGLKYCVAACSSKEAKEVRMATGSDLSLTVTSKKEELATLASTADLTLALWRRTLSWTVACACPIVPHANTPHAGSCGSDGAIRVRDEHNQVHEQRFHSTAGPLFKYFYMMMSGAARGMTAADLREADDAAMERVTLLIAQSHYNLGSAIEDVTDWAPWTSLMLGFKAGNKKRVRAPKGGRGKGAGGGGGGGGGAAGIRKGKKGNPGQKVGPCRHFNEGKCRHTKQKDCNMYHGCSDCGKKDAKKGHQGCPGRGAWPAANKKAFNAWKANK